ncbi:MAG: hypothetical protein ACJ8F7_15055 [Gemmataceae bacterium]
MRRILAVLVLFVLPPLLSAQQIIHRNDFGTSVQWLKGAANANFTEIEHKCTDEYSHNGPTSETITINAEIGPANAAPFVHYVYPTPQAPVTPQLQCSLWVRAKQAGIQVRARLVLPRVENRQRPGEMYTTYLDGGFYNYIDNWQKMEFTNFPKLLADKQQALRIELGQEVDLSGAFVDQIVLNLYTGPGRTQVWVDDLEIGPLPEDRAQSKPQAAVTPGSTRPRPHRGGLVEINRDQLMVDGRRFLPRMIRHSDTPLEALQLAGINTVVLEADASAATIDEAVRREFYLVPSVRVPELDPNPPGFVIPTAGRDDRADGMARFLTGDRVLFWYLGASRSAENLDKVAMTAQRIRDYDPQRPLAVDAWDGMYPYSRKVDMLGMHRWVLYTSLDLEKYKDWQDQRRRLARPGTFTFSWVQTQLPEWYTRLVYDKEPTATFDEPIGPQPEQIRLLTYIALACGNKGIGYWSDRFLADSHQGRDRLLSVALLNLEIQMLEPILLSAIRAPIWIDTSHPGVKAAVIYCEKGILVLPIFIGGNGQHVPAQSAISEMNIVVPMVPDSMVPVEITLGEIRTLKPQRLRQGTNIIIRDFSLTSAIVFTGEMSNGLLPYLQEQVKKLGPAAARYACDMAVCEADKVRKVYAQIEPLAPPLIGASDLLRDTDQRTQIAKAYLARQDYRDAYLEASRALRPLRRLMRLQYEQAIKPLGGAPTANPFAVCYYTLPRYWAMQAAIKNSVPGTNALTGGGFESPDPNWTLHQDTLDDVITQARLTNQKAKDGKMCLELNVVPKPALPEPGKPPQPVKPPEALDRTFVAVTSPKVYLPPGTLVRISGWVRIAAPIKASPDGAMFYDSIGGHELAVRLTDPGDWRQYILYRRVPQSGEVSVTMALTGLGSVQFDDVRIEPMLPVNSGATVLK